MNEHTVGRARRANLHALLVLPTSILVCHHVAAETASLQRVPKIGPYLVERFADEELVDVHMYYRDPETNAHLDAFQFEEELRALRAIAETRIIRKIFPEAVVVRLTGEEAASLAKRSAVRYVVPEIALEPALLEAVDIIDAELTWALDVNGAHLTASGYTVCVVDTGVYLQHPALVDNDVLGVNLNCTAGIDCPPDETYMDAWNHGTHVAGIITATGDVFGVAREAGIISLGVWTPGPPGQSTYHPIFIERAVNWCIEHKEQYNIRVITMSIGGEGTMVSVHCDNLVPYMTEAFENATAHGLPITVATGNQGSNVNIGYPACISYAIPVASTNQSDYASGFSNYNSIVKLFAPGSSILSTCFSGSYCTMSGTSMATPMVAGAVALIEQYLDLTGQSMTPHEIEDLLYQTGEDILNLPAEYSRINVYNAILALHNCPGDFNIDSDVGFADLVALLQNWEPLPDGETPWDINGDGETGFADLMLLLEAWGPCVSKSR